MHEIKLDPLPIVTGDPDELFARLAALPGEKVAKVKIGLYEAVRDGMVANLLLHGRAENCSFKKGTIWWLQQQVHAGQCRCELRAMVTPDTI